MGGVLAEHPTAALPAAGMPKIKQHIPVVKFLLVNNLSLINLTAGIAPFDFYYHFFVLFWAPPVLISQSSILNA
jgi:hypothetical protein